MPEDWGKYGKIKLAGLKVWAFEMGVKTDWTAWKDEWQWKECEGNKNNFISRNELEASDAMYIKSYLSLQGYKFTHTSEKPAY